MKNSLPSVHFRIRMSSLPSVHFSMWRIHSRLFILELRWVHSILFISVLWRINTFLLILESWWVLTLLFISVLWRMYTFLFILESRRVLTSFCSFQYHEDLSPFCSFWCLWRWHEHARSCWTWRQMRVWRPLIGSTTVPVTTRTTRKHCMKTPSSHKAKL